MKRKVFLVLAALGLTSPVFASGVLPPPEPMYFDGLYLGAGIGAQHTMSDASNDITDELHQSFSFSAQEIILASDVHDTAVKNHLYGDLGKASLAGEAFIGFGKTFNSLYGGLELFAHYANIHSTLEHEIVITGTENDAMANQPIQDLLKSHTAVEVSSNWSYGGAFRLGFLSSPKTMFYILLGVEATDFDVDVNHKLIALTSILPSSPEDKLIPAYSYGYSFDETKWGFMPGVGIETMITSQLSLRAQYTYVSYSDINHDNIHVADKSLVDIIPFPPLPPFAIAEQSYKAVSVADDSVKPHRGLFTLDLTYHFNGV